jgi:hypothetical protein
VQRNELADAADYLVAVVHHARRAAPVALPTVQPGDNLQVMGVPDFGFDPRAYRAKGVAALATPVGQIAGPGTLAADIVGAGIAQDEIGGLLNGDPAGRLPDNDDQLPLVVDVVRFGR